MIKLICPQCNIAFEKKASVIKYKRMKGRKDFCCCNECRLLFIKKKTVTLTCTFCEKEYTKDLREYKKQLKLGSQNYCSKSCSNKNRTMTEQTKTKVSEGLKKYYETHDHSGIQERIKMICPICKDEFAVSKSESQRRIYCSRTCCNNDIDFKFKSKENLGGYRRGSGRSLGGWYKGIYCDSIYELVYLIYCLDHDIHIKRCEMKFEYGNEGKTYNPDFIVNNTIVEIKGYMTEEVYEKANAVPSNIKYEILTKDLLKKEFEYIKTKYNKTGTRISELYDNYKPKYTYECSYCSKIFKSNVKKKSTSVYCDRQCSGKARADNNHQHKNNRGWFKSKFNDIEIREMKVLHDNGERVINIAKKYNTTKTTVYKYLK